MASSKSSHESSWPDCLESHSALAVTPDGLRARSLRETARARIAFVDGRPGEASFVFEGYYLSALELLHALVLGAGFKVDNHLCLGFYLRDVVRRQDLFRRFDDCRVKRNALVYYGKRMDTLVAEAAIADLKRLIDEVEQLLQR